MISDKRRRICEDGEYLVYRADILISSDYYPFGMPMPGRVWEKHVTDTFAMADTLRYYDFEGSTVTTSGIYEYVEEWRNDPGYTNLSVVSVSGNEWLRVTSTSCNHGTIQVFTDMVAGETYTIDYDVDIGTTSGVNLLWWTRVTGGGWTLRGVLQFSNTSGHRSVSFTVPTGANEVLMQFRQGNCGGPTYFMLDNIWIYDLNDQVVTFTPGGYRYGFNGMEKTDEWSGSGMSYDFEFRTYDPRLGRFLSRDPLSPEFPWNSPYAFAENDVLRFIDLEGLETPALPATIRPDGGMTTAVDATNTAGVGGYVEIQKNASHSIPVRKQTMQAGGVEGSPQYKQFKYNVELYGPWVIPGYDITKKLLAGEEITALDITAEALGIVPGGKVVGNILKGGSKIVQATLKYSDEAADLVSYTFKKADANAKEIVTITKSNLFSDARKVAKSVTNLGDDAVDYVSNVSGSPFNGKVVGRRNTSGSAGWRLDWSEEMGAHINWWNGKQKGSIPFGYDLDQVKQLIDNGVINTLE